jgi:hypothetical protein
LGKNRKHLLYEGGFFKCPITTLLPPQTIAKPTTDSANTTINTDKMEVKNYRIGNFVYGVDKGFENTAMEICSLQEDNTFRLKHGNDSVGCYSGRRLKPIPLTEEWLIKFNFVYHHDTPHPNRVFRISSNEMIFDLEEIISYYFGGSFISVELKYVHQLQNLFWILTGQELTINKI